MQLTLKETRKIRHGTLATESRSLRVQTLVKDDRLELPLYGLNEAALYLRVPIKTLEYLVFTRPLIKAAGSEPRSLSFMNLLECHMLAAMKNLYDLRLPKIRRAVAHLSATTGFRHPLIEQPLYTDRNDVLIKELDKMLNISRGGQYAIPQIVNVHLERIDYDKGIFNFYPFVRERTAQEPKLIVINPSIGFGKPVIAGTGISTAVIASRFNARESVPDLAKEYGLKEKQVEEAIRWETRAIAA